MCDDLNGSALLGALMSRCLPPFTTALTNSMSSSDGGLIRSSFQQNSKPDNLVESDDALSPISKWVARNAETDGPNGSGGRLVEMQNEAKDLKVEM